MQSPCTHKLTPIPKTLTNDKQQTPIFVILPYTKEATTQMASAEKITDVVWKEITTPFTQSETSIVLDWDDTLFCTSWIEKKGFRLEDYTDTISWEMRKECQKLSKSVIDFLKAVKELGTPIIITNSTTGWIDISSKIFMPDIIPMLSDIPIVYAQSEYRCKSNVALMWKQYAVVEQMRKAFKREPGQRRNILSFGDGISEQEAMRSLKYYYSFGSDPHQTLIKSVKLMERVGPEDLVVQLDVLAAMLPSIVLQEEDLDLYIEV